MSVDPSPPRKRRNTTDAVKRTTPEDDHRRKRRNRTTQSCLNCHTSKRMCDRKRPCGRCTQLGLTGLCVYEVDDPSRNSDSQDEKCRLQKRVAELESVIRELKNKPHPRWVAGPDTADKAHKGSNNDYTPTAATTSGDMQSSPSSPRGSTNHSIGGMECSTSSTDLTNPFLRGPNFSSHSSPLMSGITSRLPSSPSVADSSSLDTPSPLSLSPIVPQIVPGTGTPTDYDLSSLFSSVPADRTGMEDTFFSDIWDRLVRPDGTCDATRPGEHCGCLNDPTTYNAVLELSLRLRKAADMLSRAPKHTAGPSGCLINQNIAELDRFTSNALGNISTPPDDFAPYSSRDRGTVAAAPLAAANASLPYNAFSTALPTAPASAPTVSPPALQGMQPWDYKTMSYPSPPWEDSFMSWVPQRR